MPDIDIITKIMETNYGINLISIILGLGLASMFRKVCRNKGCVVIKGPELSDVKDKVFKFDNKCYQYEKISTSCNK